MPNPQAPTPTRWRISVHEVNGPLSPSPEQYPPVVSWVLGQDGDRVEVRMSLGGGQAHISRLWWAAGRVHHESEIVQEAAGPTSGTRRPPPEAEASPSPRPAGRRHPGGGGLTP